MFYISQRGIFPRVSRAMARTAELKFHLMNSAELIDVRSPLLFPPQDHYDWGLRAIKSVLVVAGSLKRGDPSREEDQVLMRALRDFNIPKIVTDDMPVFMGLIGDLFPALDVPRKRDPEFEKHVKESILDLKLQAEDNFVLKVYSIRRSYQHSVLSSLLDARFTTSSFKEWRRKKMAPPLLSHG